MIKLDIHAYTELTFRLDPLDVFFRMVTDAIAVIYFELFRSESLANSHIRNISLCLTLQLRGRGRQLIRTEHRKGH